MSRKQNESAGCLDVKFEQCSLLTRFWDLISLLKRQDAAQRWLHIRHLAGHVESDPSVYQLEGQAGTGRPQQSGAKPG